MAFADHTKSTCFEAFKTEKSESPGLLWVNSNYLSNNTWKPIEDSDKMNLKLTKFSDNRLISLESIPGNSPPEIFKNAVSGNYDVISWTKNGCYISIDQEKTFLMKFPDIETIVTYTSGERVPILGINWKPTIFFLSKLIIAARVIPDLVLIISRPSENSAQFTVETAMFSSGFICSHPSTNRVLCYGQYTVPSIAAHSETLIKINNTGNPWSHFIQFYSWGYLFQPKFIQLKKLTPFATCGLKSSTTVAFLSHEPRMKFRIKITPPSGPARKIVYGEDFAITAKKSSESDIDIYILIDGQLIKYNYSFDTRINKIEKNYTKINVNIPLKYKLHSDGTKSDIMIVAPNKKFEILIPDGSPSGDIGHMISDETIAVYNAETGMYSTHFHGIKHCEAFTEFVTKKKDTITPLPKVSAISKTAMVAPHKPVIMHISAPPVTDYVVKDSKPSEVPAIDTTNKTPIITPNKSDEIRQSETSKVSFSPDIPTSNDINDTSSIPDNNIKVYAPAN